MEYINKLMGYLPTGIMDILYDISLAFVILIAGWFVAKVVSSLLAKAVTKFDIIGNSLKLIWISANLKKIAGMVGNVSFIVIFLYVLVAFFQALQLDAISTPINNVVNSLPQYIGVAALALFTWLAATTGKTVTANLLSKTELDKKAGKWTASALGTAVYGFIILFFLPGILWWLGLQEIVAPVEWMLDQMINYIPNIIGAGIILAVGIFVARLVKQIVTSILKASKIDSFAEKVGMKDLSFSNIGGTIVYVFIMIPLAISALEKLKIDAISKPATDMLGKVLDVLPNLIGAIALITLTYIVANFASRLVEELLKNLGFDTILNKVGLKLKTSTSLSSIASKLLLIVFMLFAFVEAGNMLGLTIVSDMVSQFIAFGSSIIGGLITIVVGLFVANLASEAMKATNQSHTVTNLTRVAIIILAVAIGLGQMGIAEDIIKIAFGLLFGSIAVAAALAFGLWSRDVAAKELEWFLKKIKK